MAAVICSVTAFGASSTVILEIYDASLTTYKYTSNTNIQDIRPLVRHRYFNIDGSSRSRGGGTQTAQDPSFRLEPCCPDDPGGPPPPGAPVCPAPTALASFVVEPLNGGTIMGGRQVGLVDLFASTSEISDIDLRLPAPGFSWVIGRSFNARQEDSGGSHIDSDGYQGCNWFQNSQPELVFFDDADDTKDLIYLMIAADKFLAFNRITSSTTTFKAVNGAGGVFLLHTFDGVELATFHTLSGQRLDFFWFDGTGGAIDDDIEGSLWRIMDSTVTVNPYDVTDLLETGDGNVAYIGDVGDPDSTHAQANGYDGATGALTFAYDTADRRYEYTYTPIDGTKRLTSVEVATLVDTTWTNTGDKVQYEYYQTVHNTYGDNGCLENVIITTPLTDSGVEVISQKYFRYWTGTFNADLNPGHPKSIKYIVDFEGVRKFDWSDSLWNDSFEVASDCDLNEYASTYLEYDSNHRIDKAWFNGACGCSGASNGTFEFTYEDSTSFQDTAGYDVGWFTRTVISRPDGSWLTQYFDEVGQPLHKVISDADPETATNFWVTKVERDSDGQVIKVHSPANIDSYVHPRADWALTVKGTTGLITVFDRIAAGDLEGLLTHVKHKEGNDGTQKEYLDSTVEYDTSCKTVGNATLKRPVVDARWVYSVETDTEASGGTGPTGAYETTFTYTFYDNDAILAPKKIVTTYPAVITAHKGSNSTTSSTRYLRKDGTTAFVESATGIFTYTQFTGGQLIKRINDVKTNGTFPAGDDPNTDWGIAENPNGLGIITEFSYDAQGRIDTTTLNAQTTNDKRLLKNYYSKLLDRRRVTLRYNDYETSPSIKYFGPVGYTVENHARQAEVQAVVALSGNESTLALTNHVDETTDDPILAIETTTNELGELAQMTTSIYNKAGQTLQETRSYFLIPDSSTGTDTANYDPTLLAYDDMGRRWRVKDATGTIRRTVFDKLGRTIEQWIGTNDFSFSGGESAGPDNMVKTVSLEYDSGSAGGNGYLTKQTVFVEDSTTGQRVTTFQHDLRGRVLLQTNPDASPAAPHLFNEVDNMGRITATGLFSSTTFIVVGTDDPTTETANRLGLSQTFYHEVGSVWKTQRHKIDDGSDDDNLQTLTWYDAAGSVIQVDGSQLTKTAYDRLGRQTHRFTLANDNDTAYTDAADVTGDIVLQEIQTTYDPDTGDVIMTARIDRHHDDTGGGATTGALDTNADADDLKYTAANLKGRIQITAMWYDRFGRVTDAVQYGTNGGATFNRSGLGVPPRSDTALLTESTYDTDGSLQETIDPRNLKTRFEYDDLGRQTAIIANYVNGVPSGNNGDDDVHTRFVYTDGLRTKMWVDLNGNNTVNTGDQETIYTFGTTKGVSAGDSKIQTGHLLQKVQYPDSSGGTDVVTFAYNAQIQQIWTKDQAGNVIETDYDVAGRQIHRRATTVATDFDPAVQRISTTYNNRGLVELVTQYDDPTVGPPDTVLDQVKFTYEDWGNVSKFEQDHNSAIGGSLLYDVDYAYEKATGGRNTIRRSSMDLPDGNVITFTFLADIGQPYDDDEVSRVSQVKDGAVELAQYDYNGVGQVVGIDYAQPDVFMHRYAGGAYDRFDRFNRVTSDTWTKDLGTDVDFLDLDITYDRNSNITLIEDNVHVGFDADYTIDNLNRLQKTEEGTWSSTGITNRTRQQLWEDSAANLALDQVGNWDQVRLDLNGDNDFIDANEYDDDRTHNDANELTGRDTDDDNTDNYTLVYDAVGNLTNDKEYYKYKYDAFGRLREIKNQNLSPKVVAEYTYNGLGHRIGWHYDVDADTNVDGNDPWIRFVYDDRWRIVGTFRASDSSPKEQFIYHNAGDDGGGSSSYIDTVVCRDRDANVNWADAADDTLEERIYYCQNWRGDVVALIDDTANQVEQVRYSSYGIPFGLPAGDADSDGDVDQADLDKIQVLIDQGSYDVRADLDLDGTVDTTDKTAASNNAGTTLGWSNLSEDPDSGAGNRKGYAGYELDPILSYTIWHVRNRVLNSDLGRWTRRDPLGYVNAMSLYEYVNSNPLVAVDPTGLFYWRNCSWFDTRTPCTKLLTAFSPCCRCAWDNKPCYAQKCPATIWRKLCGSTWAAPWPWKGVVRKSWVAKTECRRIPGIRCTTIVGKVVTNSCTCVTPSGTVKLC